MSVSRATLRAANARHGEYGTLVRATVEQVNSSEYRLALSGVESKDSQRVHTVTVTPLTVAGHQAKSLVVGRRKRLRARESAKATPVKASVSTPL